MPNPLQAIADFLAADAGNLPDDVTATHAVTFPSTLAADHVHIQYAWDGTPADADNREDVVARVTVWTAKGKVSQGIDIAEGLRARLLLWSSVDVWRVDRGPGRMVGTDPDSKLPFCSFIVNPVMHALAAD